MEVETPELTQSKEASPSTGVWEAFPPLSVSALTKNMRSNRGGRAYVFKEHQLPSDSFSVPCSVYWFCMLKLFL